jgi:hypothetical protein
MMRLVGKIRSASLSGILRTIHSATTQPPGRSPGTRRPVELLGREQGLLSLRATEKTVVSLDRAKTVVGLQRICGLTEHRWLCHQEVSV